MATVNITASLQIAGSGLNLQAGGRTKSITASGLGNQVTTQSVGTSTEQLVLTDIDDLGYLYVENLDATNFVMVGLVSPVSSSNAFTTLLPGEFCLVPTRQETIYAIADTAACNLLVAAAEK
jgi:hypothetical protein